MASLKRQLPVLISLVEYAAECNLTGDEVYDICVELKNLGGEKEKLAYIKSDRLAERDKLEQRSGKIKLQGSATRQVYSSLMRSIKSINRIITANKTLEELQVERGGNEHEQLKKQYREMQRLHKIIR